MKSQRNPGKSLSVPAPLTPPHLPNLSLLGLGFPPPISQSLFFLKLRCFDYVPFSWLSPFLDLPWSTYQLCCQSLSPPLSPLTVGPRSYLQQTFSTISWDSHSFIFFSFRSHIPSFANVFMKILLFLF